MPKRFTATEKWDDPWFCGLSEPNKLFWLYLLDRCDHAGIWQVNWPLVNFHIKGEITPALFSNRIVVIAPDKWFIPKFINFQYGKLNPESNVHRSAIAQLSKAGLHEPFMNPSGRVMDMDKNQDRNPEKKKKVITSDFSIPEWVDATAWAEYKEMRNKIKKPMTVGAMKQAIKTLNKLKETGQDTTKVLEQSVFYSWQGLFPLRESTHLSIGVPVVPGKYSNLGITLGGEDGKGK